VATETTRQIIQEDPNIEAYRLGLLQAVRGFIDQNLAQMPPPPVTPPSFQVAGLTPLQQQAAQMVQQGIGAYQPYTTQGLAAMRAGEEAARTTGLGGIQEAFGTTRTAQLGLDEALRAARAQQGVPETYQQAAQDVLRGATQLGYETGDVAAQDYARAAQQAADLAAATRGDIGRSTQQAYNIADVAAQDYARAAQQAADLAAATRGDIGRSTQQAYNIADVGRSDYAKAAQRAADVAAATRGDIGRSTQQAYNVADVARADLGRAAQYGRQGTQLGYEYLGGTGQEFSPTAIASYMNPYEQQVVEQAMQDIRREGDIREQGLRAQAASVGAFGGSRQAVAESELARNLLEQQARTSGQLRMSGYQQASQQAQQAFEQAKQRQQAQAQLASQIGRSGADVGLQAAIAGSEQSLKAAGLGQQGAVAAGQQGLMASELAGRMAQAGAQTGLEATGLGQQGAVAAGQQGLAASELAGRMAQAGAQTGLQATGLGQQATLAAGQQGLTASELAGRMAQAGAQTGLQTAGLGQQSAAQLGQLGLQYGQLGQSDVQQLANIAQARAQMGQGLGSLAQAGGQLGTQLSNMGLQQAGLGQLQQQLNLGDVRALEAMGARDQALQQAILDATRQSNMQLYQMPYQQYSFLSDIYKGTPSSQQVTQISQTQDPSTFQQIAGLGIAGLSAAGGAKAMNLF